MKKKINVTFQVQYETEIEVDTDLPEGEYALEQEFIYEVYSNGNFQIVDSKTEELMSFLLEKDEITHIPIPLSNHSNYRKNSFEVVNIIV